MLKAVKIEEKEQLNLKIGVGEHKNYVDSIKNLQYLVFF